MGAALANPLSSMAAEDMEAKTHQAWARHIREEHLRGLRFGPRPPKPLDPKRKIPKQEVPAVSITTPDELEQYVSRFHSVFRYRSTQEQALLYLLGLLSDLGRKNGETMEAGIPSATQQGVWDFLVRSPWSAEALDRARVTDFLASCAMAGRPLDVVIDEVSELKQGKQSVGVARQYLGCAGKTANGQVTVSLHGLVGDYDVPLCGELYLPEAWATDADRRKKARVPEALPFRTKLEIAWQLLQRVNGTWGLGIGRVYADPGYGEIKLMRQLDASGFAYCLGVKSTFSVRLPAEPLPMAPQPAPYSGRGRPPKTPQVHCPLHTIAEIRACLPEQAWRKVAYRRGTDGTELAREFVAMRVIPAIKAVEGTESWLLLERALDPTSDDPKTYVVTAPLTATLDELAQLAHQRRIIERNSYENGKQEVGLGDYQGRSWVGYHHHLAMCWLALTWLHLYRRRLAPPDEPDASSVAKPAPATIATSTQGGASPTLSLALPSATITIVAAVPAPRTLRLPYQVWESVQQVRRRLCAWFRAVIHLELVIAGIRPTIPELSPLPGSP
jgi:SRSO17 transposase